jgi:MFS family permease
VGGALAGAAGVAGALAAAAAAAGASGVVTAWALRRLPIHRHDEDDDAPARGWIRGMPAGVWLGATVAVYINVVNGGLNAFFPLYGLAIGLTLAQIGALSGVHATLASVIRFGAGTLLGRASTRVIIVVTVLVIAGGVPLLAATRAFGPLLGLLAVVGLARGVLRVVSGALVMEWAGPSSRHRGRASGVYLAGLDLGNAVGPLLGGVVAEVAGIRASFLVLGLAPAALFLGVALVAFSRVTGGWREVSVRREAP